MGIDNTQKATRFRKFTKIDHFGTDVKTHRKRHADKLRCNPTSKLALGLKRPFRHSLGHDDQFETITTPHRFLKTFQDTT